MPRIVGRMSDEVPAPTPPTVDADTAMAALRADRAARIAAAGEEIRAALAKHRVRLVPTMRGTLDARGYMQHEVNVVLDLEEGLPE